MYYITKCKNNNNNNNNNNNHHHHKKKIKISIHAIKNQNVNLMQSS